MKRVILITLSLLVFVVPASADFIDDFNSHADFWGVNPAKHSDLLYMSGSVIISADEGTTTIGGTDPVETLAVACCVLDSIETNETFIIAGRIFQAYLQALKSEEKFSYSALWSYKTKINVTIRDGMIFISLVI